MCSQLPTTSTRLSYSAGFLAPGHAFDEVAAKDELSMEVASIEMLRNNIIVGGALVSSRNSRIFGANLLKMRQQLSFVR